MTAPLVWLLLSALAVIAPPTSTGPAAWQGAAPVVVARPSTPVSGHAVQVLVARLPRHVRDVEVVAAPQRVPARLVKPGIRRAQLVAPAPGPLTLTVEFTLHGHRYQVAGGVIFVTVGTSVQ
jgi:hypothetical protein